MAQNLKINGKQYNGVSVIGALSANGGTARFYDTSNSTAIADDIALGKTAYINGGKIVGTSQGGGATLGTKTITSNGEYDAQDDGYDGYSSVDVQVPGSSPTLQAKTNIAPTTSSQTITPDQGYDGLSSVQINAMPTGTAGTPTATKGTVSSHSVSVTPSVTNTTGYITGGTKTGTAVTVSASELDSGTKSITSNGNSQDVIGYASVNVNVPNSYSASDEGKVVSSGALVAQTAHADVTPTTSDQTIDTTTNNSIKVKGDADLVAGNIKKDVEIFGVTGSYEGGGGGADLNAIAMGTEPSGDLVLNTATNIKDRKFKECNNLTSVTAPYVTILREQIFSSCANLETISFANATSISSSQQFISCAKLKNVNLPKIMSCGNNMFQGCSKLEFIDFPAVTTLNAARCFYGCNKLQTVILRYTGGVCPLNSEAFTNTPFAGYNGLTGTLYVPSALVASYKTASNWSTLYNNGTMSVVAIEGSQYE